MTSRPWQTLQRANYIFPNDEHLAARLLAVQGCECWKNDRYTVTVRRETNETGELIWMSIRDENRSAGHDWRDFQKIKNDICGDEAEAIELYPAESRLVDTSNQFHLWCIVGMKWPFGFGSRLVSQDGIDIGQKQRRWPESDKPQDLTFIDKKMHDDYAKSLGTDNAEPAPIANN